MDYIIQLKNGHNSIHASLGLKLQLARKPTDTFVTKEFEAGNITLETKFYLRIKGGCRGCVWPFIEFEETRIRGVTKEEMRLQGYFSQIYTAEHIGPESFIFEPQLDPCVSASTLAELAADNIRLFFVDGAKVMIMGLDGRLGEVPVQSPWQVVGGSPVCRRTEVRLDATGLKSGDPVVSPRYHRRDGGI